MLFFVSLFAFWMAFTASAALAVPPTVQPSPGYDMRLEQSRRLAHPQPVQPVERTRKPRRKHRH